MHKIYLCIGHSSLYQELHHIFLFLMHKFHLP